MYDEKESEYRKGYAAGYCKGLQDGRAEKQKAKWVKGDTLVQCSNCFFTENYTLKGTYNDYCIENLFCRKCGAKMG